MKRIMSIMLTFLMVFASSITVYTSDTESPLSLSTGERHRDLEEIAGMLGFALENGTATESYDFKVMDIPYTIYRFTMQSETIVVVLDSDKNIVSSAINSYNGYVIVVDEYGNKTLNTFPEDELTGLNPQALESNDWGTEQYYNWNVGEAVSVAGLAASIACAMSGIALPAAIGIATQIISIGVSHVWAKTGISYKSDSEYLYVRRRTWFYSDSDRTQLIYGPAVAIQKKALDSLSSLPLTE